MRRSQPIFHQTDPIFVLPASLFTWAAWAWLFVLLRHKQKLPYGVHADSATFLARWGPLALIWVWSRQGVAFYTLNRADRGGHLALLLQQMVVCCRRKNWVLLKVFFIDVFMYSGVVPRLWRVCVLKGAEILQGMTDERLQSVCNSLFFLTSFYGV